MHPWTADPRTADPRTIAPHEIPSSYLHLRLLPPRQFLPNTSP